jgi:hypothetical protein
MLIAGKPACHGDVFLQELWGSFLIAYLVTATSASEHATATGSCIKLRSAHSNLPGPFPTFSRGSRLAAYFVLPTRTVSDLSIVDLTRPL